MMPYIRMCADKCIVAVLSATLFALVCMLPVQHTIDVGGYDSAYIQGFFDQEPIPDALNTSGMARWSGADAAIIVPQFATPMQMTIRVASPVTKTLTLIANGTTQVAQQPITAGWQDVTIPVAGGYTKPFTVYVALQSELGTWQAGDLRRVGVLVDRITISTALGAFPYLWPCLWVLVCSLLCGIFVATYPISVWQQRIISAVLPVVVSLVSWRWQLWYPLPHMLALVSGGLLLAIVLRHQSWITQHVAWWGDALSLLVITLWTGMLAVTQRAHVTLAVPGVEKDFRVFATRSESYASVFVADPFYNLGYPLILRLLTHLSGMSAFDSAKWWAVAVASLALTATWWLARYVVGARWAALMTITVACSAVFTQYALSLGSDMTFTALCTLSVAVLLRAAARPRWYVWAGMVAGGAFLVRHTGIILLLVMMIWVVLPALQRQKFAIPLVYVLVGWGAVAAIQLCINMRDTGALFYSFQAKNSWLAVYGNLDWGRWGDVPDTISLRDVMFNNPGRFLQSWWHNVTAVWGSSANEYERAMFIRLLSIPMNWLSVAGVCHAIAMWWRGYLPATIKFASLWLCGFVAISAVAFILPRFLLPLVWVAALYAVWLIAQQRHAWRHTTLIWAIVAVVALQSVGVMHGQNAVIELQPADERALVAHVADTYPHARIAFVVGPESPLGKYSALVNNRVYRTMQPPVDMQALCQSRPDIIVWSTELQELSATVIPTWQYERYKVIASTMLCDESP